MGTPNKMYCRRWFSLATPGQPLDKSRNQSEEYNTYEAAYQAMLDYYKSALREQQKPCPRYIIMNVWEETYDAQGDQQSWKAYSRIAAKCSKEYEHYLKTYKELYEEG